VRATVSSGRAFARSIALRRGEAALGLALAIILGIWAYVAFNDPAPLDTGLAYEGGQAARATGRPEALATWISLPLLAVVMGLVSLLVSVETAATLLTVLNLVTVLALLAGVWLALRPRLPLWAWWVSLAAAVCFAPMVSSLWWKQFNIIALALAVLGFWLIRRKRPGWAAAAIAVSICIKPIVLLLPLVLLLSRDSRRAGLYVVVAVGAILIASQGVLAIWAGELAALNPLPALSNFSMKSQPANIWACQFENFAPGSTVCRLSGGDDWNVVRAVVLGGVALMAVLFIDLLRGLPGRAWEPFALACVLSPMVSPIAWSHYQILLAPLLLVLFVDFVRRGAGISSWLLLSAGYALAMLFWQPYGSLPGWVRERVIGVEEPQRILIAVAGVAQFAQYVLLMTAAVWFARRAASQPAHATVR